VRETKFEKEQHDATPRHQGNIQRSLRNLHRDNEREERDKQRAKDEVARLNGIVSGTPVPFTRRPPPTTAPEPPKQANPVDRKRQLAQLAEMGIAVPKEYRAEMAMAGDWETVSTKSSRLASLKTEDEDTKQLNIGIRKRKLDGEEDENETEVVVRRGWGSTLKTYPGATDANEDVESLLKGNRTATNQEEKGTIPKLKKEESEGDSLGQTGLTTTIVPLETIKQEVEASTDAPVVFKKRKGKAPKG